MRRERDAYYTPRDAATEMLREFGPLVTETTYGIAVDPACGRGALLDAVAAELPDTFTAQERVGYEIDPQAAAYTRKHPHQVIEGDYLNLTSGPNVAFFIANPPFSLAQEFVSKMLDERGPYTMVACLLRLGFLASQKRYGFWQWNRPDALRILSKRPSFTGDGKTDNSEYAWYLYLPTGEQGRLPTLGWYNGS